jgi:hypothetical protein
VAQVLMSKVYTPGILLATARIPNPQSDNSRLPFFAYTRLLKCRDYLKMTGTTCAFIVQKQLKSVSFLPIDVAYPLPI